jgi:DNA-binding PucR family transcriptional regulator
MVDHRESKFAAGQLAPILRRQMPELVQRLTVRLQFEVAEYAEIPTVDLARQSEAQLEAVLSVMLGDLVDDAAGPSAYGRMRAEQGVPLESVLHAYRVAWAELWAGILESARQAATPTSDELLSASAEFFWMADDFAGRMVAAYRGRATELLLGRESERSATLEGVFSGYLNGSEQLWEAAAVLDLPYDGQFLVVAAEPDVPGREALPGVQAALRGAGISSAWRLGPDVQAGIVSMRTPDSLATLLERLREPGVRIGLSSQFTSLAGTPHALYLARLTLASLPPAPPALAQFDESPMAALIAASPRTARDLVESVLGEVVAMPIEDRETLLSTASAWFETAGSTAKAARRLFCHANTVRYRLNRLEALTGRTFGDPRDVADIRAAIIALRMLPDLDGP